MYDFQVVQTYKREMIPQTEATASDAKTPHWLAYIAEKLKKKWAAIAAPT